MKIATNFIEVPKTRSSYFQGVFCPYCGSPVTCSCCGEPLRTREALQMAVEVGHNKYCGQCGQEIASTLAEVLAKSE